VEIARIICRIIEYDSLAFCILRVYRDWHPVDIYPFGELRILEIAWDGPVGLIFVEDFCFAPILYFDEMSFFGNRALVLCAVQRYHEGGGIFEVCQILSVEFDMESSVKIWRSTRSTWIRWF
jgi:hypothetical protein